MPGGDESIALGRILQVEVESTCDNHRWSEVRGVDSHRACCCNSYNYMVREVEMK